MMADERASELASFATIYHKLDKSYLQLVRELAPQASFTLHTTCLRRRHEPREIGFAFANGWRAEKLARLVLLMSSDVPV